MPPELHFDPTGVDFNKVVADKEAIRKVNLQRFEMEQLDAIVYLDPVNHLIAGYKDIRPDEFWVRGHMPGHPLLPGVLICEAAAQLCCYYLTTQKIIGGDFLGFGGLENVRFRNPVYIGDRLVLIGKALRLNRRQTWSNVQAFVGATMVFHGDVLGVAMNHRKNED